MAQILIVDDSGTARMFIKRCIEIAGLADAEFFEAGNGNEALGILDNHSVTCVITDLNMPECDGEMLLKQIKARPRLHDIPVVVITSAGNPAKELELMACGAVAVLSKPVSPAAIADAVGTLVNPKEDNHGWPT